MELTIDQTVVIATGNGETDTATGYLHGIRATQPISAHTWTCGANLAQWKAFTDERYWITNELSYILSDSVIGAYPQSEYDHAYDMRQMQAFDY